MATKDTPVSYTVARSRMAKLEDFTHHGRNMFGFNDYDFYNIFSYSTLIGRVDRNRKTVWVNPNKYSVTTSKQQGYMRAALFTFAKDNGYSLAE